jgi:hypothetical protein
MLIFRYVTGTGGKEACPDAISALIGWSYLDANDNLVPDTTGITVRCLPCLR